MLLIALLLQAAPAPACPPVDRAQLLALDFQAFDQDMTSGWRLLSNAGCDREAADLIRDWSAAHPAEDRGWLLRWHEGQLRANVNETAAALALFRRAYKRPADDPIGWNHYVDGSIAFLRRDRGGLATARARLAAVPKPAGYAPVGPDGKSRVVSWPPNLSVLDGLGACWGKPYRAAYGCEAK